MVDAVGLGVGLGLLVVFAIFHYSRGATRATPEDMAQDMLQRRAESVPETDFPEPMNRAPGGGGGGVAGAVTTGGEGELAEPAEEDETGYDPSAIPDDEVESFDIEYVKEGETLTVSNTENLLEAGEEEGWDLPYACREGQCLSCAGRIPDGDAHEYMEMSNNEVLSDEELEKGYILTCVAYPQADFSIETSESP
jgi:2Fe-2S type ferredoxin